MRDSANTTATTTSNPSTSTTYPTAMNTTTTMNMTTAAPGPCEAGWIEFQVPCVS